jgi:hypothetical protein
MGTRRHKEWRHGNMETWRHGIMDMETWRLADMDMETWTWRHGHEDMDIEIDMNMET